METLEIDTREEKWLGESGAVRGELYAKCPIGVPPSL
jgi:hypothetical protein